MAETKPTKVPRWADTGSITEPAEGKKDDGWLVEEKPPAQYFNWLLNLTGSWFKWFNERFFDGSSNRDLLIRAIDHTANPGTVEVRAGDHTAGGHGGDIAIRGGRGGTFGRSKASLNGGIAGGSPSFFEADGALAPSGYAAFGGNSSVRPCRFDADMTATNFFLWYVRRGLVIRNTGSVPANSTLDDTFTLTGVRGGDHIIANPSAALPAGIGIVSTWAPANNQCTVRYMNTTVGAVAVNWSVDVVWMRLGT